MRKQRLSIRDTLLLTIGSMTLLIVLLAGYETTRAWQQLAAIHRLKTATEIGDHLFDAASALTIGRGTRLSLLQTHDPKIINHLRPLLKQSQEETDTHLDNALQALHHYRFHDLILPLQQTEAQWQTVKQLRHQIAAQAALPKAQRDQALAALWFSESTTLILQTQKLWMVFAAHFTAIDAYVSLHMRFKHVLSTLMELSGRERALVGRLIVENASPTDQDLTNLLLWRGNVEHGWRSATTLAAQSRLTPAILPYLHEAESQHLTLRDMVGDISLNVTEHQHTSYPISAEMWFTLAAQAVDSLRVLKQAARDQTWNFVQTQEAAAKKSIALHALLLVVALGLCFYSFRTIAQRVLQPIYSMITALIETSHTMGGESVFADIDHDEIETLTQILRVFRESGERYRALVEASSQIIWTWRPGETGEMTALKQWWEAVTGQPGEAMLPFGWLEVVHPEDRETAKRTWSTASAQGNDFEMEYRVRDKKTGGWRHVYVRGVALKKSDGTVREFIGALNDITLRKEAEEAIRDSADRLRAVFDTVLDGIITIDPTATILSFNAAAERIFGYKAEEVIGRNVKILMPEPYHSEHDGYVHNFLHTGKAKVIGIGREVTAKRKDGSIFPMELGVNAFTTGGSRAFAGIIRDISERKAAEEEKRLYTSALERSNQELDDFAYIASHDLKEPLRGLSNNAMFLREDYAEKLDETANKRLKRMVYLCERMEQLVNDLLYFSRLGRQELAVQETNLNEVIHDIESMMEATLHESNAVIYIPEKLPTLICDFPRITEVFRNLITNAVKYNDKPEKRVEIGYLQQNAERIFYVKDNGIGIATEFYNDVFRIFKRLNNEDDSRKGTGVGLTFVKKIIERHNGRIWLESELGVGTTFYFTLREQR